MSAELGTLDIKLRITSEGKYELMSVKTELEDLGNVAQKTEKKTKGFTDALSAGGRVASSAIIVWDRYTIAQTAVENAQIRVTLAQDRLQYAISKHGANSREAINAQRELEISTNGVEIAQQRLYVRMVFGTLVVIPDMIRGIKGLIEMSKVSALVTNVEAAAHMNLARARLFALGATVVGIPLAIGGFVAGQALANAVPQNPSNTTNIYGNYYGSPIKTPADSARSSDAQASRTARR